ncbi:MAG: hypothetical protein ACOY4K_06620 [Pseudomonadota bacterium]
MPTRPLTSDAPPGWTLGNQTLKPEQTIAGYIARGEELKGGCRGYGCRRSFWLDQHARAEAALAHLPLSTVLKTLRCGRLDGCSFEFHPPRPDQSIRLSAATGRAHVRLKVCCSACEWTRLPRVEEVIAVLEKDRAGGSSTRVHEVAAAMRKPCPACKALAWSVTLVWLRTDNMIWKAKGERQFDEMRKGGRL